VKDLLLPFYEHPADRPDGWDAVVAAAPRLYGVVLNPANGPGSGPDPGFAAVAGRLRRAGVRVLGYADTDYGRRRRADVVRDLELHRDWYGADGAFLDQVCSGPDTLPHYRRLAAGVRRTGAAVLVLNHGVHPDPAYAALADLLVTFEGPWDAYRTAGVPSWTATHPPERFCHLVYAAPPGARAGAAVQCVVPGAGAHPWNTLPYSLEPAR
jgi:hypothetical protein